MSKLPPGWDASQLPTFETSLPLACQLFVVADQLAKDLRGTLKEVKQAGYDGVEFAGGLKYAAQEVKYALDEAGLAIAGWHIPWRFLSPGNIHSTITYNKVLGNQFLIVPWMPDETLQTKASCLEFAQQLTWVSDVLGQYGMVTGYHNHKAELYPTSDTGELPWDIIAQNTPANVIMQNDIGNGPCGYQMMDMLKKYPGRAATVHVKPWAEEGGSTFFDAPNNCINWDEYFHVCRSQAGVRWYIIEYLDRKRFPDDPVAGLAASAKWFRAWMENNSK